MSSTFWHSRPKSAKCTERVEQGREGMRTVSRIIPEISKWVKLECKAIDIASKRILTDRASSEQVNDAKQHNGTNERHDQRWKVEAAIVNIDTVEAEHTENEAAQEGSNDTNYDVQQCALLCISAHNDTCQPTYQCTEHKPDDKVDHR